MKKKLIFLSTAIMMLSLAACGGTNDTVNTAVKTEKSTNSQTAEVSTTVNENKELESSINETDATNESESLATETSEPESKDETTMQPSDDLFAFQVSIDGKLITFPCAASDMGELGYSFGDKAENILENNYKTSGRLELSETNRVSVGIVNISGSAKTFAESMLDGVIFNTRYTKGQTIAFAKGITMDSTREDVIAAYGEANVIRGDGEDVSLTYCKDPEDRFKNYIKFTFYDGVLTEVDIDTEV